MIFRFYLCKCGCRFGVPADLATQHVWVSCPICGEYEHCDGLHAPFFEREVELGGGAA